MSAAPARSPRDQRPASALPARAPTGARARNAERRRRERHFRRRRRDLLEDAAIALIVVIVLLSVTAGLGVLALLELPIGGSLVACSIAERRLRARRKPRARHGRRI